jgi:hypothetical protein
MAFMDLLAEGEAGNRALSFATLHFPVIESPWPHPLDAHLYRLRILSLSSFSLSPL